MYQGRSDDMLKVGGNYVSPFEVESALISHPAVLEAAVVAHDDEHGLVKPRALVVLCEAAEAAEALAEELKAHVKARLSPYKYPRVGRVRERAAQDRDRQDPAIQAAARIASTMTGIPPVGAKVMARRTIFTAGPGAARSFTRDSISARTIFIS